MRIFFNKLFLFPLLAIFSLKFYIPIICYFRGYGQGHLLRSCGLAAVLMTVAILYNLQTCFNDRVYPAAEQIPEFYYQDGKISLPDDGKSPDGFWQYDEETGRYVVYKYDNGQSMLAVRPDRVYYPENVFPSFNMSKEGQDFHVYPLITLNSNNLCVEMANISGDACFEYSVIFGKNDGVLTADTIIRTLINKVMQINMFLFLFIIYLILLFRQAIYITLTTLISLILQIIVKISLPKDALLRVNVYAHTLPLALLVLSFFFIDSPQIFYTLNNEFIILLPLFYVYVALSEFRKNLIVSVKDTMNKNGSTHAGDSFGHIKVGEMNSYSDKNGEDNPDDYKKDPFSKYHQNPGENGNPEKANSNEGAALKDDYNKCEGDDYFFTP